MVEPVESRVAALEGEIKRLRARVARLEGKPAPAPEELRRPEPPPQPKAATAPPPPSPPPPARPPRPATVDLEELLGGRLLALVGGVTVILGLVFLVALAVERGWLDERARTGLAFANSAALLLLGAWLHERRGGTQASLATVGTGLAGLFLSLTAATVLYELLPVGLALAGAFVFGAIGAALAIRWDAQPIGGLGILGALAAPILVGATEDAQSLLFLAAAHAVAIAVLVWRRWDWLRLAAVALVLFQITGWAIEDEPSLGLAFTVLALFGLLNLAAGLGFELRRPSEQDPLASHVLVLGNAAVLALVGAYAGWGYWDGGGSNRAVGWWLAGLAVAHVLGGLGLLRLQPRNRDVAIVLLGVGLVGANLAFVVLVDGVAIPIGWAAAAAALALPVRTLTRSTGAVYAVVGAQIVLAAGHVVVYDAPWEAVAEGGGGSIWPIVAIAASAFAVARLTPRDETDWRAAADATALLAVAYGTAVLLDGWTLAVAWVVEAVLLAELGRRLGHRVAAVGSLGFLLLAALHALSLEAHPDSLVYGADPFWQAAVVLGAVGAGTAFAARRGLGLSEHDRPLAEIGAVVAFVYLASVGIVSGFQPGTVELQAGDLSVREQGQAVLSAFWSLLGLAVLWAGLRRDERTWRLAGFALLAVAVGKVFLYDMAALDAGYRVLSFIVLGLLLLAGAYAYQRMRRGGGGVAA